MLKARGADTLFKVCPPLALLGVFLLVTKSLDFIYFPSLRVGRLESFSNSGRPTLFFVSNSGKAALMRFSDRDALLELFFSKGPPDLNRFSVRAGRPELE